MQSIFTDDFPIIDNNLELEELVKKYFEYDRYYIVSGCTIDRRTKFDNLYSKYYPYADTHFLTEVKKKFHQRTWEMYLGCALLDRNIIFSSKNIGPDFLIEDNGKKIWIECIACEKGAVESPDRVPDMIYGIPQIVPVDEILIRIAGALKAKKEKYDEYIKSGIVKEEDQFIIAVNAGGLGHSMDYWPLILKCVFAVGYPTLSIPVEQGPVVQSISTVPYIFKKNGRKVPMTFFIEKENMGICAVMYSKNDVLNHPHKLGEDIILVHNPLARTPLEEGVLDSFRFYKINEKGVLDLS